MLNEWFYSHATWQVGAVVCGFLVFIAITCLLVFHRVVRVEGREKDNKMVGLSYALCGGLYAVMLAFVAAGVYETLDKSTVIASSEANSLAGLAFDSAGLPAELGVRVRGDLDKYIDIVTGKEWPSQRAYRMEARNFENGWAQVRRISLDIASFEPKTPGQATVKTEMEKLVNDLFSARRTRLLAASAHLANEVWEMLVFGLVLVLVYLCLMGPSTFKMHITVITLTMLSVGLVFTLVIALDYPFRGDVSVEPEAYFGVREIAKQAFEDTEK